MSLQVYLVEERRTLDFAVALDNCIEMLWKENDHQLGNRYADLIRQGQVFPPIFVCGRIVHDGYHRLYAYRKLFIRSVQVIDLKKQPDWYYDEDVS